MENLIKEILIKHSKSKGDTYSVFECVEKLFYQLAQYYGEGSISNIKLKPSLSFDFITGKKDGITCIYKCDILPHQTKFKTSPKVYIVSEFDDLDLEFSSDFDFCTRVLKWSSTLAEELKDDNYSQDIKNRMQLINMAKNIMEECIQEFNAKGYRFDCPTFIGVFPWRLNPTAVANYTYDSDIDSGVINLNPLAFTKGEEYLTHVIKHELIHAYLYDSTTPDDPHGENFQKLADDLNIPKVYQD